MVVFGGGSGIGKSIVDLGIAKGVILQLSRSQNVDISNLML
jgi:hypothetical protein